MQSLVASRFVIIPHLLEDIGIAPALLSISSCNKNRIVVPTWQMPIIKGE